MICPAAVLRVFFVFPGKKALASQPSLTVNHALMSSLEANNVKINTATQGRELYKSTFCGFYISVRLEITFIIRDISDSLKENREEKPHIMLSDCSEILTGKLYKSSLTTSPAF